MFDLSGKKAFITGGSRGIGRGIVEALWSRGADVAVAARNVEPAQALCDELLKDAGEGRIAKAYSLDITNGDAVESVVKQVVDDLGGLDIVVNNAGVTKDNLAIRMTDEQWNLVVDTNLRGAFNVCRAVFRPLRKSNAGRIINITSVIGLTGNAGQCNYAASKAGLIGLTKSLAREYASRKINVNAIAPGYVRTDMTAEVSPEVLETIRKTTVLERWGTPEDIAPAVVFLASDEASFITGQTLNVCGGFVI